MRASYKYLTVIGVGIILTLTLVSGCLFHQNKVYESQNRKLIIQNDSIMSVNIELKNFLEQRNSSAIKTSTKGFKEEGQK